MIQEDYKKIVRFLRDGNVIAAINVLRSYNDEYFISRVNKMITPSERVALIAELEKVIKDDDYPNLHKKQTNTPTVSILEVLNILCEDEEAFFYPTHEDFEYQIINSKKEESPGYPVFTPELNTKCSFGNFTWHKEQLNLSLLCKINGTINVPNTMIDSTNERLNKPKTLSNKLSVHQWRNYSLIFNGELNIKKLPISASLKTLQKLADISGTSDEVIDIDDTLIYVLDLSVFPLISKKDTSDPIYAKKIIELVIDEVTISAKQKIYKSLYEAYKPTTPLLIDGYTDEETKYLSACGLKADGSYSPPIKHTKENIVDTVFFKIDIKGYSSIPSLKELLKKEEESGSISDKYTPPMLLVNSALNYFYENTNDKSQDEKIEWLKNIINKNKIILRDIKKQIQKDKLILLLGRTWFKDLGVSTAEQIINVKTDKFPGKKEVSVVIRVHREEVKR